jgi:hypothetical protein
MGRGFFLGAILYFSVAVFASGGMEGFQPDFPPGKIGGSDWPSVYSHIADFVEIKAGPADRQAFENVAIIELTQTAPSSVSGQATYFRSRPISVPSDQFVVTWSEKIEEGVVGLQLELWGEVGSQPNQFNNLLLRLRREKDALMFGSDQLTAIQPGWRHFKVVVSVSKNTFDLYYEDMDKPVASSVPLQTPIQSTDRLGLGFSLYLLPGTPPMQWQVGGVSVLPL